jgi:hypothetical protein
MAQRLIERACSRFLKEISSQDTAAIESTAGLDDVKCALGQIERHLAARQSLRNFDRILPFLDAAERFSHVVEVVCKGTPYLPWIWVCFYSISVVPILILELGTYKIYSPGMIVKNAVRLVLST